MPFFIPKTEGQRRLKQHNDTFVDEASAIYGRQAIPRKSDVFITTAAKCGTTLVTQICHMLRSGGDINFDEISTECPWNIFTKACGQDMNADHKYEPRVFKAHDSFEQINKNLFDFPGCKYIVVCRDPIKCRISSYNFIPGLTDSLPILECTKMEWNCDMNKNDGWTMLNWPAIYLSWYKATKKYSDNILWVFYEDLVADQEKEIRRILNFMELVPDKNQTKIDELVDIALEKSNRQFMLENVQKFDEHFILQHRKKRSDSSGNPKESDLKQFKKVQNRAVKSDAELSTELEEYVQDMWKTKMFETGCSNYEEFRQKLKTIMK